MTEDLSSMAFTGSLTDPDEIDWQFSLGRTSLDKVMDSRFPGMSAVEACLALLCQTHGRDAGTPTENEERSLRMLVEDALGSTDFQTTLLPKLVAYAIEANNSSLVTILLSYAEDEKSVLAAARTMSAHLPRVPGTGAEAGSAPEDGGDVEEGDDASRGPDANGSGFKSVGR